MAEKTTARFGLPFPSENGKVAVGNVDFEELVALLDKLIDPPGKLRFTYQQTLETGWLKCEGQEVNRTTQKQLFEAIGTSAGAGNGITTFNVPDFRNRVPVGSGLGATLGEKFGVANVTLTTAQMPVHNHAMTIFDAGHFHPAPGTDVFGNPFRFAYWDSSFGAGGLNYVANLSGSGPEALSWVTENGTDFYASTTSGVATANIGFTKASAGESNSHTNLQPSTVCNVWIKT